MLSKLPDAYDVQTIRSRGSDQYHLFGFGPQGAFNASIQCDASEILATADKISVDKRIRHVAVMRNLADATQTLLLVEAEDGALLLSDGRTRNIALDEIQGKTIGIFGADQSRGLVIVTTREVYLLDVDAALDALAEGAVSPPLRHPSFDSKDQALINPFASETDSGPRFEFGAGASSPLQQPAEAK